MSDQPHHPPEPTEPHPPRYRWLRRAGTFAALLLLALLALRLGWGHLAEKRLAAALADIRARGEPVYPEDYQFPGIPDERNAAVYYRRAIAQLNPNIESPAQSDMEYHPYPPFPDVWHRMAKGAHAAHGPSLALVRQARQFPHADWGITFTSPMVSILLPHLQGARELGNLIGDCALYLHFDGNDAEALELIRDGPHLARMVDQEPILVSHLVAIGLDTLALSRLAVIASAMVIEPVDADSTGTDGAASRTQIHDLINELLAEDRSERGRRAQHAERTMQLDSVHWLSRGSWVLRPMSDLEILRLLEWSQYGIRAAEQSNWPAAKDVLDRMPKIEQNNTPPWLVSSLDPPVMPRYTRIFSDALHNSSHRAVELEHRITAQRRLVAISLAVQMYRTDTGAWPAALEDLVPRYLSHVPDDPFTDGQPLQYVLIAGGLPDGSPRPVAYSVGVNGTLTDETLLNEPRYELPRNDLAQWLDLALWAIHTKEEANTVAERSLHSQYEETVKELESSQAVDDQPDESDDPREDQQ